MYVRVGEAWPFVAGQANMRGERLERFARGNRSRQLQLLARSIKPISTPAIDRDRQTVPQPAPAIATEEHRTAQTHPAPIHHARRRS